MNEYQSDGTRLEHSSLITILRLVNVGESRLQRVKKHREGRTIEDRNGISRDKDIREEGIRENKSKQRVIEQNRGQRNRISGGTR